MREIVPKALTIRTLVGTAEPRRDSGGSGSAGQTIIRPLMKGAMLFPERSLAILDKLPRSMHFQRMRD